MSKPFLCMLGLHKWYVHNVDCHWFLFDADETCLRCGKYAYRALTDMLLNTVGQIRLAQSLQYGPDTSLEGAIKQYRERQRPYYARLMVPGQTKENVP